MGDRCVGCGSDGAESLIVVGIIGFLWIFFSDAVMPTMLNSSRMDIAVVVRIAAGAAVAGGAWLLAVAHLRRRGENP